MTRVVSDLRDTNQVVRGTFPAYLDVTQTWLAVQSFPAGLLGAVSPAFTGVPVAPTAAAFTNNTQIATTAYADQADAALASAVTVSLALKANIASPTLTGVPAAPTAAALNNSTQIATTAYADAAISTLSGTVNTALALKAPLASPTFTGTVTAPTYIATTSMTAPVVAGGGLASSTLVLESTTGTGTSDSILFKTGSQVTRGQIKTDGAFVWSAGTASNAVDSYGAGSNQGLSSWNIASSDSSAVSSKERYTAWISNTSAGTGDGTVAGTTFVLGVTGIKANWTTSTVAGQFCGINVVVRGGYNNAVDVGDVTGYIGNVAASYTNNYIALMEGTSNYLPAGSTTGSVVVRAQVAPIRVTGLGDIGNNPSFGFFAQAQNGASGVAFGASNSATTPSYGTAGTWNYFLKYDYDDGVNPGYVSFSVLPNGGMTIAGQGAANTNQKLIRVGGSVANNLEIVNAANSALIWSLSDTGLMSLGTASTTANGGVATVMSNVGPTGSHTAIQEWLTFKNSSGATRYVPAF